MKPTLQLKLGQSLTMTPQLQQAIRLLQLSTLDLQQEIQEALESNPMLEVNDQEIETPVDKHENNTQQPVTEQNNSSNESTAESLTTGDDTDNSLEATDQWDDKVIPADLEVDTNWDDLYQTTSTNLSGSSDFSDINFDERNSAGETLQDHLLWQLNLTLMSDTDRIIALAIIDGINTDGMLTHPLEEIHYSFEKELDIELDEVVAVLRRIQQFDPVGIAARSLSECLLLQLMQLPEDTPWRHEAELIINGHLESLAVRDYATLKKKLKLKDESLSQAIQLIQTLNPKPGAYLSDSRTEYVVPDVYVSKVNNRWRVELNPDIAPKIQINNQYASMVRRADSGKDNTFLRNNLQEARWFIKSLTSRNETLLKVASRIVEIQQGFLDQGEEAMKPLVLHDIAELVEMHESTISRVTTQKYMHTPRGIFELKYFFSSHLGTDSGGECSSTAIRAIIKKLVVAENPIKPLSDNKISALLKDQGINVARRTIAKYRESMQIPPSNERKQLPQN
ncbi:MAG: RNA polymerase factor sigma-54 [Pseudomonadales bacterium]|nr:RNA polymerase factor sigma-54 [Pseudomonadales bacterium]